MSASLFAWIKALHIIFMVCWFAGIFYLPRLFVNHAMDPSEPVNSRLCLMERKLYRFITPFAVLTVLLGLWMLGANIDYYLASGWMHAKLALVLATLAYQEWCRRLLIDFEKSANRRSHKWYRVFNEVTVLLFIAITLLVVIKPF